MHRFPSVAPFSSLPSVSNNTGIIPGIGLEAEPGFRSVAPGKGDIKVAPVSVCHQVSTIGHFFSPTTL